MTFYNTYRSPLGEMLMCSDGEALSGLWFAGQKYFPDAGNFVMAELEVFESAKYWLNEYFSGRPPLCPPPLSLSGTDFQLLIWNMLLEIPYGSTVTYGRLAAAAGKALGRGHMSPQAVGGAVGRNPISIIVPCHRAVGAKGSLTGYAGGLERKEKLLFLERTLRCTNNDDMK